MKDFLLRNKKWIAVIISIYGVLLVLFIVNMTFAIVQSGQYSTQLQSQTDSTKTINDNWANCEIKTLQKQQLWLEQQLQLSKSDSFSLGINLHDSLVQVHLKGTILFQAKILAQKPASYISGMNKQLYLKLFGTPASIDFCDANIPKRALIKVIAPPIGTEKEAIKTNSTKPEAINWVIRSSNGLLIVINGVVPEPDSTMNIKKGSDIFTHRIKHAFDNPFTKRYTPMLYLWLNDTDAKAIYRALPEKAKFIIRN